MAWLLKFPYMLADPGFVGFFRKAEQTLMDDARILVRNAEAIVTMDPDRRVIKEGFVLTCGPTICAIGEERELSRRPELLKDVTRTIDASGCVVLPGLINTHHHLYQTLFRCVPAVQNSGLFDWLTTLYPMWSHLTPEMVYTSAKAGIAELILSGCTTTSDLFYVFPSSAPAGLLDETIRAAAEMGIRFYPSRGAMTRGKSKGGLPPDEVVQDEDTVLRDYERVVAAYHDTSPFSMCRVALAPCSPFSVTTSLLKETREFARSRGLLCHTHLAETEDENRYCAEQYGLRPVDYLDEVGWLDGRTWVAHAVYLNEREIRRLSSSGTAVSHCPTSNMRLGSGVAPVADMLAAGVTVSLGVDGSASNDSSHLLNEGRMAMLLQRAARRDASALGASDILELLTIGGARTLHWDDALGSLEPGKAADLIAIDLSEIQYAGAGWDPVAAVVFSHPGRVKLSLINGKVVVENGALVNIDIRALARQQNLLAASLAARC